MAIAVFPVCYIKQVGHFAPLSVVSLLTVSLTYQAFGCVSILDWIVGRK